MERISSEFGTDCCKESSGGPLLDSIDEDENEETKETEISDPSCGDSDHLEYISNLKAGKRKKESVVRFAPNTKPESKPRIGPPRVKPIPHNPRKVGRANLQRDIPFFLVFILILMIMALASHGVGQKKKVNTTFKSARNVKNNNIRNNHRTKYFSSRNAQHTISLSTSQLTQQQQLNALQDRDNPLAKIITESTDTFPTTEIKSTLIKSSLLTSSSSIPLDHHPHCRLFLGESSIPSAGLSWFAGKHYDVGEVLLSSPLKIKNAEDKDKEQQCHFRTLTPDVVQLHDHELFLKHHPTMANLEHRLNPNYPNHYDYVAIRTISPGDELWIHVEHHPHRYLGVSHPYYRNIPTPKDYFLAELVVEQMIFVSRSCVSPCRSSDIFDESYLTKIQEVVELFNPRVSNLLPSLTTQLQSLADPSSIANSVLRNRTIHWLWKYAQCMDALVETSQDDHNKLISARSFSTGELVMVVPLLVHMKNQHLCEQQPSTHLCLGHVRSKLRFCLVTLPSRISIMDDDSIHNTNFTFGVWDSKNHNVFDFNSSTIYNQYATDITINIVASRNIKPGDEIVLSLMGGKLVEYGMEVHDRHFPKAWYD